MREVGAMSFSFRSKTTRYVDHPMRFPNPIHMLLERFTKTRVDLPLALLNIEFDSRRNGLFLPHM